MKPAVLITGGARRVGHALALFFAEKGYDVALHYHHSASEAEQVAAEIRKHGVACALLQADLSDTTCYSDLIQKAYDHFPRLSVLINNASVFDAGQFLESDSALYQQEFRLNTEAPIFLTQAFAKIVGRGAVVNMLDSMITRNKHHYFFYLLSKKTLAEFTRMAAVDLGPHIRVNGVCPGYLLPSGEWNEDYRKRLEPTLPLQKTASLYEVAQTIYSLVENSGLTGQLLYLDGGEHLL